MDSTGQFTTQQPVKIIEVYFATKSVLLTHQQCRRDFRRNNVPDRRTIQRLIAKFRETGSVADAPQKPQWSRSFKSFKSFKSNKPGHFQSFDWYLHKMFLVLLFLISLPLQNLNFVSKELKIIMKDPQDWCSGNASFLWERVCWFSGGFLMAFP